MSGGACQPKRADTGNSVIIKSPTMLGLPRDATNTQLCRPANGAHFQPSPQPPSSQCLSIQPSPNNPHSAKRSTDTTPNILLHLCMCRFISQDKPFLPSPPGKLLFIPQRTRSDGQVQSSSPTSLRSETLSLHIAAWSPRGGGVRWR